MFTFPVFTLIFRFRTIVGVLCCCNYANFPTVGSVKVFLIFFLTEILSCTCDSVNQLLSVEQLWHIIRNVLRCFEAAFLHESCSFYHNINLSKFRLDLIAAFQLRIHQLWLYHNAAWTRKSRKEKRQHTVDDCMGDGVDEVWFPVGRRRLEAPSTERLVSRPSRSPLVLVLVGEGSAFAARRRSAGHEAPGWNCPPLLR